MGFTATSPSEGTAVTPVTLLDDLKNGTKTRTQLKKALLGYMKKEACKTEDNITRYTPEARRNKNIVNYVGFEKEWAVINKRSPSRSQGNHSKTPKQGFLHSPGRP